MPEKINSLDRFLIITQEKYSKQEHSIEVSEKERRTFEILNRFGETGRRLLSQFYDQYIPETLTIDNIDGDFDITLEFDEIETLTTKQREFLSSVIEQLKNDHVELMKSLRGLSKEDLLKQLYAELFPQGEKHEFDSERVSVSVVPGGIGVLIHDHTYFNEKFSNSESIQGLFYKRGENYSHSANFPGRIFVVDTTNSEANSTFRHEYLHLLTDNYIEPYEITPDLPDKAVPIQKEIDQLQEHVTELREEMNYVEYDDILAIQQKIGGIQKRITELHRKKMEIIDASESYLRDKTQHLFKDVRDELSAYAMSGQFNTRENTLIPRNTTWHERVDQIDHESDRKKFVNQWEKLKLIISFCKKKKVSPNDILPIFLTSQNFEQMTKRILLFTQEQQNMDVSQKVA